MYASLAQTKRLSILMLCDLPPVRAQAFFLLAKKLHGVAVGPWFGLAGTWARCSGQSPGTPEDVGENGGWKLNRYKV